MADCTKKTNQELTLRKNSIVDDTNTTSAAKTSTKYITSAAEHAIEYAAEHITEYAAEHAVLRTSIENITSAARTSTKDLSSVARKLLDISMIGAAPFNHLIQKSWKNLKIQIYEGAECV